MEGFLGYACNDKIFELNDVSAVTIQNMETRLKLKQKKKKKKHQKM